VNSYLCNKSRDIAPSQSLMAQEIESPGNFLYRWVWYCRATARSAVSSRRRDSSLFFVSITENRLREVGIAAINLNSPEILLSQVLFTRFGWNYSSRIHIPIYILAPNSKSMLLWRSLQMRNTPNLLDYSAAYCKWDRVESSYTGSNKWNYF
jgi:hypothetical protein